METVKEIMLEKHVGDLEKMVEDAKEEAQTGHPLLSLEAAEPKGGSLIKEKPFDPQPVIQRVSILTASYSDLEAAINATDTSRITTAEAAALNEIKRAYQVAKDAALASLV